MKYCIRLTNEKGKEIKITGNEYIDIDVFDGNKRISTLTLKPDHDDKAALFNENDLKVYTNALPF